jgi:DNA-binding IclR family transcriptional regulator
MTMTVVLEKEDRQVWPTMVMEERPVWPTVEREPGFRLRRRDGGRTQAECRAIGRAMEQKCMREERQAAIHAAFWQGGRVAETDAERYLQTCAHRGWNRSGRGVDTGTLIAEQRRRRLAT